ncbi:MAG: N-acetyltransferase [Cytophagales bacterium]|nr:N-acetyltransferase [Cytophaga sp.]
MKPLRVLFFDNKGQHQFELHSGDQAAVIEYELQNNSFNLLHTHVPVNLRGKGMGKILLEKVLREIDADRMRVIPSCAFVKDYLSKNPKWDYLWR